LNEQKLSLIVAMARNGVIGNDNKLPWRLSIDLKRFRALTMGHHIVMGRKTFESIGRLLPGRKTVIVSRNPRYQIEGAIVVASVDAAIKACADDLEIFFIGGAQLYRQILDRVERIYLTEVDADVDGDAHFPPFNRHGWKESSREAFSANELNEYPHQFIVLDRVRDGPH
jgi:dihydrofolate reductase